MTSPRQASGRRPRVRLPEWVSRLGSGGVPEALVATAIFAYSELYFDSHAITWEQFFADTVLAVSAALVGRWPLVGGIGTGLGLTAMGLVHDVAMPMTFFCMLIPVVSTGVRGLNRLRDIFALWYLATVFLITGQFAKDTSELIQSGLVLSALVLGAWGTARTIHRWRSESIEQAGFRVESLKSQRRSIARDLHDTVAYATTTMIMRAEEIKLRTRDDAQLVADLDFIIATGRRSVRDLRGMLEALRRNDPSFDLDASDGSPWRLVGLREVLESRRTELEAYGLTLAVTTDGDLDALPESVRETLGKLIVEATSNMVKHAAPGPCQIIIDVADGTLEAVFTNHISREGRSDATDSGGLGLLGATERVEALGGELEATRASGTWILRAQLPVGGE